MKLKSFAIIGLTVLFLALPFAKSEVKAAYLMYPTVYGPGITPVTTVYNPYAVNAPAQIVYQAVDANALPIIPFPTQVVPTAANVNQVVWVVPTYATYPNPPVTEDQLQSVLGSNVNISTQAGVTYVYCDQ